MPWVSRAVSSATIRRKSTDAEAFPGAGARSERPLTSQQQERRSAQPAVNKNQEPNP